MKKAIALFLTLCMTLLTLPLMSAYAANVQNPVSNVSHDDTWTAISDYAGLKALTADGKYYLTADITIDEDRTEALFNGTFTGSFDGAGHSITFASGKGLTLSASGAMLFKTVGTDASITNLALGTEAAPVTLKLGTLTEDETLCGLLAAETGGAVKTISNIHVYVNMDASAALALNFGGLFGSLANSVTVQGCSANGSITLDGSAQNELLNVGGITGIVRTGGTVRLTDCVNKANIVLKNTKKAASGVGGMIGSILFKSGNNNPGLIIRNCANLAQLDCVKICGGIIGYIANKPSGSNLKAMKITGCYQSGTVMAGTRGGGIVGSVVATSTNPLTICGCLNLGTVKATVAKAVIAGILGQNFKTADCTITMCLQKGLVDANELESITAEEIVANYKTGVCTVENFPEITTDNFTMKQTAAVRIVEPMGIRFTATINADLYQQLVESFGDMLEIGTLIAPEQYVKDAGDFTVEKLEALRTEKDIATPTYLACVYEETVKKGSFTGAITAEVPEQYSLNYTAISYIAVVVEGERIILAYAAEATVPVSMATIAKLAYDDPDESFTEEQKAALAKYFAGQSAE